VRLSSTNMLTRAVIFVVLTLGFVHGQDGHGKGAQVNGTKPASLTVRIGTSQQQAKRIQQQQTPGVPVDNELEQLQLQAEANNDLAHRLIRECPKVACTGKECGFITTNGCRTCVCPIGSPARGCDRLPDKFWRELTIKGCPNLENENGNSTRTAAKKVIRWYRYTDESKGISECRYYMFPYCSDSDYNLWRSPRTKAECSYYCFRRGGENEDPPVAVPL